MPDHVIGNHFGVGVNGAGEISILRQIRGPMTKAAALNLATWIVVLSQQKEEFLELLKKAEES